MTAKTTTHDTPVDVLDALDALLDAALQRHYDHHADEAFIECRCCGDWDGHRDTCPMPGVIAFMK